MATSTSHDEDSHLDGEVEPRSAMTLLRSVVIDLTHVVEDSTDLVSASLREEFEQLRVDMTRQLFMVAAVLAGLCLVTAGLAMFVARWLDSWAPTLVLFGALYLGVAGGIIFTRNGDARG